MENITVKDILTATGGRLLCGDGMKILSDISIDSRNIEEGTLFVPLIGEKVDAHRFLGTAVSNGAAAVLTSEHDEMVSDAAWIRVEDTKKALQAIGAYIRARVRIPLVGITGSVGKTTAREMTAAALSARYRVFKTPGNSNSQVGVPITLSRISGEDEIGVLELGMSEPGELTVIAKIANVDTAVITNIGVTHIEQLGSRENIYREKLTIQDGLKPGGSLILNGDDDMLRETKAREGFQTVYYGTGENCDYRATDISLEGGYPSFMAVHRDESARVKLLVMGIHSVSNAMAALAVAGEYGVPMAAAAENLGRFTGFQNRQQICEFRGVTVIDDTYNASPVSMKAGIDVLASLQCSGRRIAVLGDMKELGEDAGKYHFEVGAYLAGRPVDELLAFGELAAEFCRGAMTVKSGFSVRHFTDMEELSGYLKSILGSGDCVLFKASNSMRLGELASQFTGERKQ